MTRLPETEEEWEKEIPVSSSDLSIDNILKSQLKLLKRITRQLGHAAFSGQGLNRDEIQSLATIMRLTLDLKAKEKELLDGLTDEELEELKNKT